MSTPDEHLTGFRDLPRIGQITLLLLGVAAVALTVRLWPEWCHNPDFSHGLLMPFVFTWLLYEARLGSARFVPLRGWTAGLFGLLLAGALAALVAAGLYAASVDWTHPLVDCSLTAALVLFLAAGVLVFASTAVRFVGFNWTIIVAILLWFLCTPIPPGTYTRLTIALQLWVSESVLQTLHLFGIAAVRHGNVIELARATVGVEEACSGVRSLISCVFAGLFFSATLVRRPLARALIIVLAAPLALGMNFLRALILTLLCNQGIDIAAGWHDATGFAVLGVTAALLAGLALLLERPGRPRHSPVRPTSSTARMPYGRFATLTAALTVAAGLVFIAIVNTRPSVREDTPAPDLAALLPASAPGWQVSPNDSLYQFRDTLQTSDLAQRTYRKVTPDGRTIEVILYAAYWRAGQAPVSLVASHTPDACWPGSGWQGQPVPHPEVDLHVDGRQLADAEYRLFKLNDYPQYVWFWHLYDGRPIQYRDPYSPVALLKIAWKYGFQHDGDQMFVRVSSNRPWPQLANDPLLREFFRRIHPLGL